MTTARSAGPTGRRVARGRPGPGRGYYYQLLAGAGWTSLPRLRRPTLLLAGDDDPLIPLINGHIMHRLIPAANSSSTAAGTWT